MFRGRVTPLIVCVAAILLAVRFLGCVRDIDEPPASQGYPEVTLTPESAPADQPPESADGSAPAEPGDETSPPAGVDKSETLKPAGEPEPAPQPEPPTPAKTTEPAEPAPAEANPEPAPPPTPAEPTKQAKATPPPIMRPDARAKRDRSRPENKAEGTVVIGTVAIASNVPDPSTVPYKDCVTYVKYKVEKVESGDYQGDELLAVLWGMEDGKLKPAASFSAGQKHRLVIEPFSDHSELSRLQMADDTNEYSLTPYWVKSYSSQ